MISSLPTINAFLNLTTFALLVAGFIAIKSKKKDLHQFFMLSAFVCSTLFLACYLFYHYNIGSKKYLGEGILRPIYFTILISHTILAVANLPMILRTFFTAWKEDFAAHKKIAKYTLPIWAYVSITGVIVYLMLYVI